MVMTTDSTATISRVQNRYYNSQSQHIRRKHSTVRQYVSTWAVRVDYVQSSRNLTDPLTKGLAHEKVWDTSKGMGLKPNSK